MEYMYITKGVCPRRIKIVLEGNVVKDVVFLEGGCNGNLQAVPRLVKDMTVEEIEQKLSAPNIINCKSKNQLTKISLHSSPLHCCSPKKKPHPPNK